ncbi:MAG: DUF4956 domain-containing protein [Verrucomicrobiota bacterium]
MMNFNTLAAVAPTDVPDADELGPLLSFLNQFDFLQPVVDFFHTTLNFRAEQPGLPEIFFATILAFGLMSLIAAVYKATFRGPKLSQDYVHTLIILGTVVTMIVMVVRGGNSQKAQATAFGMFAAFSIIRFRVTLSEARDISFIFLAMAAGLAVGARQYGLALATTLLISAIIYGFSRANWFAPNRASHNLRIRVTNDINYDFAFKETFSKFLIMYDLLSVESIQAGMMTELRYTISLKPEFSPGELVSAIQQINGNNRVYLTSTSPNRTLSRD